MSIYPKHKGNRESFWFLIISMFVFVFLLPGIKDEGVIGKVLFSANILGIILNFYFAYFFKSNKATSLEDEYSLMIQSIESTSETLSKLKEFINQEKDRITHNQEKLMKLLEEKESLTPVLNAQRKEVDAILNGWKRINQTSVWKERVIGFTFGILSSTAAAILYDFFK